MEAFYDRLKKAMDAKHVTAYRISKDIGVHQSNFTHWARDEYVPGMETLKKLSHYLNVSVDYLLNGPQEGEPERETTHIPVLGIVPCGVPIEAIEDIVEWIEVVPSMVKDHFGLIAKGDSMYPYIMNKDILIVKHTPEVSSGKIAIVKVNGDEAVCKKLIYSDSGITLMSFNVNYDPMTYTKEQIETLPVTVIGEVVEIRRRF